MAIPFLPACFGLPKLLSLPKCFLLSERCLLLERFSGLRRLGQLSLMLMDCTLSTGSNAQSAAIAVLPDIHRDYLQFLANRPVSDLTY